MPERHKILPLIWHLQHEAEAGNASGVASISPREQIWLSVLFFAEDEATKSLAAPAICFGPNFICYPK